MWVINLSLVLGGGSCIMSLFHVRFTKINLFSNFHIEILSEYLSEYIRHSTLGLNSYTPNFRWKQISTPTFSCQRSKHKATKGAFVPSPDPKHYLKRSENTLMGVLSSSTKLSQFINHTITQSFSSLFRSWNLT